MAGNPVTKPLQYVRHYRTLKEDDYPIRAPLGFEAPHSRQSDQRPAARPGEPDPQYPDRADFGGRYGRVSEFGSSGMAGASAFRGPEGYLERVHLWELADHV